MVPLYLFCFFVYNISMSNFADNKRALFDYDILEKIQAGLMLSGQEVKSVRNGGMSLKGAFVTFHDGLALLTNAHIAAYKAAGLLPAYDPERGRPLLLRKKEIERLRGKSLEQGLTIVPLRVYNKGRFIKVEIAVARGRHKYDKREAIKKRDAVKEMRQAAKIR